MGPICNMACVLVKRGKLETEIHTGRRPGDEKDGYQTDTSLSQGMSKTAGKPPEDRAEA